MTGESQSSGENRVLSRRSVRSDRESCKQSHGDLCDRHHDQNLSQRWRPRTKLTHSGEVLGSPQSPKRFLGPASGERTHKQWARNARGWGWGVKKQLERFILLALYRPTPRSLLCHITRFFSSSLHSWQCCFLREVSSRGWVEFCHPANNPGSYTS